MRIRTLAAGVLFTVFPANLSAAPEMQKIGDIPEIHERLLGAAIAYELELGCSSVRRSTWRVFLEASRLRTMALDHGYSEEEVSEFIKNRDNQEDFRTEARAYIEDRGGNPESEITMCLVAARQMGQPGYAGRFLTRK